MKRKWHTLRRALARLSLFVSLFAMLYGLFTVVLMYHDFRDDADRIIFRKAVALDKAIYQLKQKKDSLFQVGIGSTPTTYLLAEIQRTDSLINKHRGEHNYIYSSGYKKKLRSNKIYFAKIAPYSYWRSILKPTLPILSVICVLLAGLIYQPAWNWLARKLWFVNR